MKTLKSLKSLSLLLFTGVLFTACSNDDDKDLPEVVNEEEVITTMTVTLSPEGDGADIILQTKDLDGDGSEPPVITVSESLTAGATYSGSVVLLNESVTPAENITDEVRGEADEHQFFFVSGGALDVQADYADDESDYVSADTGKNFETTNPVGIDFTLTAGAASTGTLTVTLRHQPKKPNDGTLADAGGESDINATFPIEVE